MIIDCDVHINATSKCPLDPFVPQKYREAFAAKQNSAPGHGYVNPFGVHRRDIEPTEDAQDLMRVHLDPLNISYAVLQPGPTINASLIHAIDVANGYAQATNDWLIANYLEHSSRLLGSVAVNMNDPAAAAAEVRRVGGHPQMVQVLTNGESTHLYGHRYYNPIYEACCEMGLVFAIHPGSEGSLNSTTPVGRPSSYFEWHNSLPLNYQGHLGSFIAEGTFERFPELRVLLVEGGVSWLAPFLWRADKNFKGLRSTVPWLKERPSEYVFRHCRMTTQPVEEPDNPDHLIALYSMIHAERTLCFSTDFPHWDFDDPVRAFPSRLPKEMKDRIFYDTAAELFGLPTRPKVEAQEEVNA